MLIIISPAKTLDYESTIPTNTCTRPLFADSANQLARRLKKLSGADISQLMGVSSKLGVLNSERYRNWKTTPTADNARQAIFAFKGDVYAGMGVPDFSKRDLQFAQKHLRILSGLYGILRPLDIMQPYRLEMGTKFPVDGAKNLYEFWGNRIVDYLNEELAQSKGAALVNLASNEYSAAAHLDDVRAPVITPVFKEKRNGAYKIISFNAKKARGMMSRFVMKNRLTDAEDLKQFCEAGYRYNERMSDDSKWLFTREGAH